MTLPVEAKLIKTLTPKGAILFAFFYNQQNATTGFSMTAAEIQAYTTLTTREQANYRKKLVEAGLITEWRGDNPCRLFYKVNVENYKKMLAA